MKIYHRRFLRLSRWLAQGVVIFCIMRTFDIYFKPAHLRTQTQTLLYSFGLVWTYLFVFRALRDPERPGTAVQGARPRGKKRGPGRLPEAKNKAKQEAGLMATGTSEAADVKKVHRAYRRYKAQASSHTSRAFKAE